MRLCLEHGRPLEVGNVLVEEPIQQSAHFRFRPEAGALVAESSEFIDKESSQRFGWKV